MRRVTFLVGIVFCGCYLNIGQQVDKFAPAFRPNGTRAQIAVSSDARVDGELLAVSGDTALVVLTASAVSLVPLASIQVGTFDYPGICPGCPASSDRSKDWQGKSWPLTASELRLLSRFPVGMPDTELARLLAEKKQSAPRVVR